MTDADSSDADARARDAKIREEWRRLERKRLDEEIAEAREDAVSSVPVRRRPGWIVWLVFALALVAGIVVTALINGFLRRVP